jgi:hypothetical protein
MAMPNPYPIAGESHLAYLGRFGGFGMGFRIDGNRLFGASGRFYGGFGCPDTLENVLGPILASWRAARLEYFAVSQWP